MIIGSSITPSYGIVRGGLYQTSPVGPGPTVSVGQSDKVRSIDRSTEIAGSPTGTADNTGPEQESQARGAGAAGTDTAQLTPEELRLVDKLKQIDTEVRNHEMAHIAAGGSYITSGASFTYQKGPDGKSYAVGGEVGISTSPVPGDPEATLRKMEQVKRAALAPGSPSSQDRKVAANAAAQALKATSELTMLRAEQASEQNENRALGSLRKDAADAYTRVSALPESETSSFKTAV